MKQNILKVHPEDNVIVALTNLAKGEIVRYAGDEIVLQDAVQAKHKFTVNALPKGSSIIMYGVLVGITQTDLGKGSLISTTNIKHAANHFETRARNTSWQSPDISRFHKKTFNGFHRSDGSVGTANYWLVIPLVFCENRNIDVLQEALVSMLQAEIAKRSPSFDKPLYIYLYYQRIMVELSHYLIATQEKINKTSA